MRYIPHMRTTGNAVASDLAAADWHVSGGRHMTEVFQLEFRPVRVYMEASYISSQPSRAGGS
jgi:hypothetical protein